MPDVSKSNIGSNTRNICIVGLTGTITREKTDDKFFEDNIVKYGVSIFAMVTGVLLLGREIGRIISSQDFQNGVNGIIIGLGLEALYGVAYELVTEGLELINNLSLVSQMQGESSNNKF